MEGPLGACGTPGPIPNSSDHPGDEASFYSGPIRRFGNYIAFQLNPLGHGTFGEIWLARRETDNQVFAVKVPILSEPTSEDCLAKEASFLSLFHHPNIARMHEYCATPGARFIAMEYVRGGTLEAKLSGGASSLTPGAIARIVYDILLALEYINMHEVVHLDIS